MKNSVSLIAIFLYNTLRYAVILDRFVVLFLRPLNIRFVEVVDRGISKKMFNLELLPFFFLISSFCFSFRFFTSLVRSSTDVPLRETAAIRADLAAI